MALSRRVIHLTLASASFLTVAVLGDLFLREHLMASLIWLFWFSGSAAYFALLANKRYRWEQIRDKRKWPDDC